LGQHQGRWVDVKVIQAKVACMWVLCIRLEDSLVCIFFLATVVGSHNSGLSKTATTKTIGGQSRGESSGGAKRQQGNVSDENNNEEMAGVAPFPDVMDIVESEAENWSCVRCTFLNHPVLNVCECCSFERSTESGE